MYKLAMPLSITCLNDETRHIYVEQAKRCGAKRIFIGGMGNIYSKNNKIYTEPDRVKKEIEYSVNLMIAIFVFIIVYCKFGRDYKR